MRSIPRRCSSSAWISSVASVAVLLSTSRLLSAQSCGACAQASFATAGTYLAGIGPAYIAVTDFNGDGKRDLAVANFNSDNISILLGNGDGTFGAAVNYGAGIRPSSLALADFNGDGKVDLAATNTGFDPASGTISILLGNGDGTFQAAVNYANGTGSGPGSVAAADFNADGKLDLAVANEASNNLSILLGNGDGTFQGAVNLASGNGPHSVAIGDFNGDGKPDLAVAVFGPGSVFIRLGNGDGTFQSVTSYAAGDGPTSVAIADFNGDGKLDLAVVNNVSGNVSILLGSGDGMTGLTVNCQGLTALPPDDRARRLQRGREARSRRDPRWRPPGLDPARKRRRHVRSRLDLRRRIQPCIHGRGGLRRGRENRPRRAQRHLQQCRDPSQHELPSPADSAPRGSPVLQRSEHAVRDPARGRRPG